MPGELVSSRIKLRFLEPAHLTVEGKRKRTVHGWVREVSSQNIGAGPSREVALVATRDLLECEGRKSALVHISEKNPQETLGDILHSEVTVAVLLDEEGSRLRLDGPPWAGPTGPSLFFVGYAKASFESRPLSFEGAQEVPDAYVLMVGDYGGVVYIVCPMRLVRCSEEILQSLHRAVAEGDLKGCFLIYQRYRPTETIPGGRGRRAMDKLWLSKELEDLGLEGTIRAILAGARDVQPLFRPDFDSILARVRTGGRDLLNLERAIVQTLKYAGFSAIRCGHSRKQTKTGTPVPDLYALNDGFKIGLIGECTTSVNTLPRKLRYLAGRIGVERNSFRNWTIKPVLFTSVESDGIGSLVIRRAEALGIAVVPSESLVSMIARARAGHSFLQLFDWFTPGIPEA